MKKILYVCFFLAACFSLGRISKTIWPSYISKHNISLAGNPLSKTSFIGSDQVESPKYASKEVNATSLEKSEISLRVSQLIREGRSNKLFQAIYDKKIFTKTPITQEHLKDLRARFSEPKANGFILHKSMRDMQDRDFMAVLQAFATNKQIYVDRKIQDEYVKILQEIASQKTESIVVKRQAARNLAQVASLMSESEKRRLWADIPMNVRSLAAYSDADLIGALHEN